MPDNADSRQESPAPRVEILMAAYQGGRHIEAQLESIGRQTYDCWRLHVRDDCSTDDTFDVARRFAAHHPERVTVGRRPTNSGAARQNFLELLAESSGDYVMLADDDDVWLDDKVALTFREMIRIETVAPPGTPILVHTDLSVVDSTLRVVSTSMARSQRLAVGETRLERLLVQNSVTGCTVMINRALADLVRPPFDGIAMHDWWLAILAAAFGRISYVPVPTILYRQHGGNAVGATDARSPRYLLGRATDGHDTRARIGASSDQAAALLARYGDRLSERHRLAAAALADLASRGKLRRLGDLARYGLWKNTLLRRIGQVWFV